MNQTEIDELRRLHEADSAKIINAMANIDWQQHLMNAGGCFHVEDDGRLCGRADRWSGHGEPDFHMFVPLYVAATKLAKGNALPRLLAALEEARAERTLMEKKVITCGVAASHPDPLLTATKPCYAETWNSPQAEAVRALRAERDKWEGRAKDRAKTNLKLAHDIKNIEYLAWDALGRPDGTHDTTNVQRLCEAHGELKAKLAEARAERLYYRTECLELLRRIREGQLVTATEASLRYEVIIEASSEEPL